jgi:hypothetical protein
MSPVVATKATCRCSRCTSVHGGRTDLTRTAQFGREWTRNSHRHRRRNRVASPHGKAFSLAWSCLQNGDAPNAPLLGHEQLWCHRQALFSKPESNVSRRASHTDVSGACGSESLTTKYRLAKCRPAISARTLTGVRTCPSTCMRQLTQASRGPLR